MDWQLVLCSIGVDFFDKVGNFFYHMLTFYSDFHFDGEFSEIAIQIVGNWHDERMKTIKTMNDFASSFPPNLRIT